MSIESQPQLTQAEVDSRINGLERQLSRGEEVASIVENITEKYVPKTLQAAEELVEDLTTYDAKLREDVHNNPGLKEEIGEDYVDDLHQTTLSGLDNWRLTQAERSAWGEVVGIQHAKRLSPRMRNLMDRLSDEEAHETEVQKLARLKSQAHDRLTLDAAIDAKYGKDDREGHASAEPATEELHYDQKVYKNGAKHFYAAGTDGKKKHVSAAAILADYGHAGDFQGKRPAATADDTEAHVHVKSAEQSDTPVEVFVRPDTVSAEDWDGYDSIQKRILTNHPPKQPKKELVKPENYPWDDWDLRDDVAKARIIKSYDPELRAAWDNVQEKDKWAAVKNLGHIAAAKAGVRLTKFIEGYQASKLGEYYNDIEKGKRRKITTAVIAGAAALAGAGIAYMASRNGMSVTTSGNRLQELMQNKPHDIAGKQQALAELHSKPLGGMNTGHVAEKLHTVKLHQGDTIWAEGKENLIAHGNRHPNKAQITEEMHRVMQLNHIDEDEARHLAVGTKIKL